ncbi:Heat shock protein DnaJ, cysteine-rich domain protein [Nannochloropsis gaditana]|uniref:Heat shock protein DnaJ, cysteine-rich domain protein n=1 Tax=Nannochloropsis gaditana TaxID=72520 RepID=W7TJ91_9STRA|nr:Heat shock protein DnaJ, cysteine-rich domain protein [Nannochloropsis gaditana]
MVVDVYRIKKKKGAKGQEEDGNYMQRFSGDWETTFKQGSKWSVPDTKAGGMALRQSKPDGGAVCPTCKGGGKNPCFNCKGKGVLVSGQRSLTCYICKGEGMYFCADCQATGMISRKKV